MSSTNQTVLCGGCKSAVETVPDPKPNDQVSCPRCGRTDRFDKVMESVGRYAAQLAAKHLAEGFAKSTRGNSFIKLTVKHQPDRSFRWICSEIRF